MVKKRKLEDLKRMQDEMKTERNPVKAFKMSWQQRQRSELCDLLFGGSDEEEEVEERLLIADIDFRQREILRMLNGMRRILVGRDISFRPMVTGEDGRLSNEKIDAFIQKLISYHPEAYAISEDKKKLLERFFYCVILGPSLINTKVHPQVYMTEYSLPENFNEFIVAAKEAMFSCRDRLNVVRAEERERHYSEFAYGFSFFMNQLYETFSGKSVRDIYTKEELEAAADVYGRAKCMDTDKVLRKWENRGQLFSKCVVLPCKARIDYDLDVSEEEVNWLYECCFRAWERYCATLPKENHFVEYYRELRELLHKVEPFDILDLIEVMIDRYLIANRLSPLWNDDEYAIISGTMEKFMDEMEKRLKE
ncbi:MAG: hypothetical protein K5659_04185 [Lachnospiraceae bacterium]|nr:hypothetical protein [Lachnospiraceae bacterium]